MLDVGWRLSASGLGMQSLPYNAPPLPLFVLPCAHCALCLLCVLCVSSAVRIGSLGEFQRSRFSGLFLARGHQGIDQNSSQRVRSRAAEADGPAACPCRRRTAPPCWRARCRRPPCRRCASGLPRPSRRRRPSPPSGTRATGSAPLPTAKRAAQPALGAAHAARAQPRARPRGSRVAG